MNNESILVTGGAGFIGSAMVERLIEQGADVLVGDRKNVPSDVELLEVDLHEDRPLEALNGHEIDTVFHLAGQSSGEKSFDDPEYDLNSHVVSTFNLLRWCKANDVNRILYASSMSVYGDPEYLPVDEIHPVDPKTYYAAGKLGAEAYVKLFDNLGLNTTIFRLFSVYGPGQNMTNMKQGMVSIYLSFVLRGEKLLIKGSTDRFRDFVYVEDVIDAWIKATNEPDTYGEVYNVCRNKRIEVSELVDTMLKVYGEEDHPIEVTDGTPGDQFGIWGDSSKLQNDIQWSPTVSIEEGLKRMIEQEK
jgi:UDP-glucose 4-epimerase